MWARRPVWMAFAGMLGVVLAGCTPTLLTITPTVLPNGVEGSAYSRQLTAGESESGAVEWTVSSGSLPAGLRLDENTGTISGTPATPGTSVFTVSVEFGTSPFSRAGRATYSIEIIEKLRLDATLDNARIDEAYNDTLEVTGGVEPYTFQVVGLPAGMSIDTTTGVISGTPLTDNSGISLSVTVTDGGGSLQQTATATATFVIKPQPVSIATTTLADGTLSAPYSEQLVAVTGRAPYTWTIVAGLLPDGLRLDRSDGTITGTPEIAQARTFTVEVTDSDSPATTDSQELEITIGAAGDDHRQRRVGSNVRVAGLFRMRSQNDVQAERTFFVDVRPVRVGGVRAGWGHPRAR